MQRRWADSVKGMASPPAGGARGHLENHPRTGPAGYGLRLPQGHLTGCTTTPSGVQQLDQKRLHSRRRAISMPTASSGRVAGLGMSDSGMVEMTDREFDST